MSINKNILGQGLAFLFSLSSSSTVILLKKTNIFTTSEQLSCRYFISIILMILIAKWNGLQLFCYKKDASLISVRVLIGLVIQIMNYLAITLTNPSDLIAIIHSSIIFMAILSRLVFDEKLSVVHIVSILISIIGVILITKPKFIFHEDLAQSIIIDENNHFKENIGYLLSGAIAFLYAIAKIVIKKLANRKIHFSIHIFYLALVGLPLNLTISFIMIYFGKSDLLNNFQNRYEEFKIDLFYLSLSSLLTALNTSLLTLSLQYEDATKVSIIHTFELFFTFILQYFFLNISSDWFKISGSCMIIFSGVNMLLYKLIDDKHTTKIEKQPISEKQHFLKRFIFFKI